MVDVFLSMPTWVPPACEPGREAFRRQLGLLDFQPRTLGATDFGRTSPLDEVIRLMDACRGAIVLGYPQLLVESGRLKGQPLPRPLALPTEWNHIEAGLAYARGLPLLVLRDPSVERGIFDRGATKAFLYDVDLGDPAWPLKADVVGALRQWRKDVIDAMAPDQGARRPKRRRDPP